MARRLRENVRSPRVSKGDARDSRQSPRISKGDTGGGRISASAQQFVPTSLESRVLTSVALPYGQASDIRSRAVGIVPAGQGSRIAAIQARHNPKCYAPAGALCVSGFSKPEFVYVFRSEFNRLSSEEQRKLIPRKQALTPRAKRQDSVKRRFVLIEIESQIARNLTAERVRRVSEGYTNAKGDKVAGLGGGFRFCELGEPLFDQSGTIREVVRYCELARHVYFTETGEPLPRERVKKSPLLGVTANGVAVYLLYNGILEDKSVNGGNILTSKTLALLPAHSGLKVLYAAGCRLSNTRLKREGITFKQTPYAIKLK